MDQFGVLGPLVVHRDGVEVVVTAAKQRVVLAALLLHGSLATADLIRCVWGPEPPARAARTLPVYVMRLRRALGEPRLVETTPTGYRLAVPDGSLDLHRFRALVAEGAAFAAAGREAAAREAYERALGCWRGAVLADVDTRWLPVGALEEERRQAESAARRPASTWTPVSQLPAPVGHFVGRTAELARVADLLTRDQASVNAVVVSGPPGVGKTAFAISTGHALRGRFPDGRLYVNLRGYSPMPALATTAVLARFLRALGVRVDHIPLDEAELVDAYRTLLRGRRVLVILDNAASADQVLPLLLPDEPGCSVLITSRGELRVAGAAVARLSVLDERDARELLARTLRTGADDAAVAELARLCGYLPLALRIAVGNLVGVGDVAGYVAELREGDRLSALAVDNDDSAAVRRAFDLSYATLRPAAAELFRLLGLVPGPDVSAHGAAALLGAGAEALLDELTTANLVQRLDGDRFAMHDLLRDYAAEQARGTDPAACDDALRRLFDWYLRTANEVAHLLYPELGVPRPSAPHLLGDEGAALAWLDAERPSLFAATEHCARVGPRPMAWQLVNGMGGYLGTHGHHVEFLGALGAALAAARADGDRVAEAQMLVWLACEHRNMGDPRAALEHLDLVGEDTGSAAWLMAGLRGILGMELSEFPPAVAAFEQLLAMGEAPEALPHMRISALTGLGAIELMKGEVDRAFDYLTEGVELARSAVGINIEATGTCLLGRCHLARGDHATAIALLRRAVGQWDRTGSRHHLTEGLAHLATALTQSGDHEGATAAVERAMAMVRELGSTSRIEAEVHCAWGLVLRHSGDHAQAIAVYRRAVELATASEHSYGVVRAHLGSAEALACAHEYAQALDHSRMALDMAVRAGFGLFEVRAREMVAGLSVTQLTEA
ncbi:MAG: tetratricopeptide repeat protein [Umezawaea sp.]